MIISNANLSDDKNITDTKENQSNNLCYIYRHIRLDTNEVFYIGKGKNTDGRYSRSKDKNRRTMCWKNIVKKHKHSIEIVIDNLSEKEAFAIEIQLILDYGRLDLGTGTLVNMTEGGDGASGYRHTEEAKKKLSEAQRGKKKSEESRKNMSIAQQGKTHTEEAKEKCRIASTGRTYSNETREKLRKANQGKKRTPEAVEKSRQAILGRKQSKEHVEKRSKKVGKYKDDVLLKEYPSIESAKLDGFNPICVGKCCNGKRKTHGGFQWKFL